jgi:hypothetical protein
MHQMMLWLRHKQQHPMGPIVWEQTWHDQDAYYCEANIITTNIVGCASNSSPLMSTTLGKATKEKMSQYMVKEKASLKQAVPSLLAALDDIIVHPSKAEDTGTAICTGKTPCTTYRKCLFGESSMVYAPNGIGSLG